jgi:hypothetical protein
VDVQSRSEGAEPDAELVLVEQRGVPRCWADLAPRQGEWMRADAGQADRAAGCGDGLPAPLGQVVAHLAGRPADSGDDLDLRRRDLLAVPLRVGEVGEQVRCGRAEVERARVEQEQLLLRGNRQVELVVERGARRDGGISSGAARARRVLDRLDVLGLPPRSSSQTEAAHAVRSCRSARC